MYTVADPAIIINAKIKVTLNTNVAGALYKNYQTK